jgi:hypothetical protein
MKRPDIRPACATNQLSRGESEGDGPLLLMAINEDDVIYILTKADVEDIAKDIGITKLTELHYQKAQQFFDSFVDGPYDWTDAVSDGLRDAEEELRGGYGDVPDKKQEVS